MYNLRDAAGNDFEFLYELKQNYNEEICAKKVTFRN
jgi:hypothetical protein